MCSHWTSGSVSPLMLSVSKPLFNRKYYSILGVVQEGIGRKCCSFEFIGQFTINCQKFIKETNNWFLENFLFLRQEIIEWVKISQNVIINMIYPNHQLIFTLEQSEIFISIQHALIEEWKTCMFSQNCYRITTTTHISMKSVKLLRCLLCGLNSMPFNVHYIFYSLLLTRLYIFK